jgi:hypothetical protein
MTGVVPRVLRTDCYVLTLWFENPFKSVGLTPVLELLYYTRLYKHPGLKDHDLKGPWY